MMEDIASLYVCKLGNTILECSKFSIFLANSNCCFGGHLLWHDMSKFTHEQNI